MIPAETSFASRDCRRCGRQVLAGHHGGISWRVHPGIRLDDARLVHRYGLAVLVLSGRGGLWAHDFDPSRDVDPADLLAVQHVCGSPFAEQLSNERYR